MSYFKKFSPVIIPVFLLVLFAGFVNQEANAQRRQYTGNPVTKYGLVQTLKGKQYQTRQIIAVVASQGVNFRLTSKIRKELVSAGARPSLLNAVGKHYRRPKRSKGNRGTKTTRRREGNYQNLLNQALEKYNTENDTKGSIELLKRAIKMRPRNSRAYQMLGFAYLHGLKDYKNAEPNMRKAISLGGSAVFRVRHGHDLTFSYSCEGSLYVSRNDVRYESDNIEHTFNVRKRTISKVTTLGGWGKLIRRKGGAFKITIRDSKEKGDKDKYNFAPVKGKKKKTAKLIIKLIGK